MPSTKHQCQAPNSRTQFDKRKHVCSEEWNPSFSYWFLLFLLFTIHLDPPRIMEISDTDACNIAISYDANWSASTYSSYICIFIEAYILGIPYKHTYSSRWSVKSSPLCTKEDFKINMCLFFPTLICHYSTNLTELLPPWVIRKRVIRKSTI